MVRRRLVEFDPATPPVNGSALLWDDAAGKWVPSGAGSGTVGEQMAWRGPHAGKSYTEEVGDDLPVLWYRLDDGNNLAYEQFPSHGQIANNLQLRPSSWRAELGEGPPGATQAAFSFPGGTGGYYGETQGTTTTPPSWTLESWVKLNTVAGGVMSWLRGSNNGHIVGTIGFGTAVADYSGTSEKIWIGRYESGGAGWGGVVSANPVTAGQWLHIVGTYNDVTDELALWVNGLQVGSVVLGYGVLAPETAVLFGHGYYPGIGTIDGLISELAVYGGVLAPDRIEAHYSAGLAKLDPYVKGDVVRYDGAAWVCLGSGTVTTPGQSTDWALVSSDEDGVAGAPGAYELDELTDVDVSSIPPLYGQALVWDGDSLWVPGSVASGGGGSSDLLYGESTVLAAIDAEYQFGYSNIWETIYINGQTAELTFVPDANGKAFVEGEWHVAPNNTHWARLWDGVQAVGPSRLNAAGSGAYNWTRMGWLLDGLTPGVPYTVQLQLMATTSTRGAVYSGPKHGPIILRAWRTQVSVPDGAFVGGKAENSGVQTVTANTDTVLTFDTVLKDTDGLWDAVNNRWLATAEGVFLFHVSCLASGGTGQHLVRFRHNGTLVAGSQGRSADGQPSAMVQTTALISLVPGDYVEAVVYTAGTSVGDAVNAEQRSTFSVAQVNGTAAPSSLDGLADVQVAAPVAGDLLMFDGSEWVADQPPGGSADVDWQRVGPGHPTPFENGWVNYGSTYADCAYRKGEGSVVYLRGLVKSGSVGQAIFTLPVGYRPLGDGTVDSRLLIGTISNNNTGRIAIMPNGQVIAESPTSSSWVSLDGLSFFADQ